MREAAKNDNNKAKKILGDLLVRDGKIEEAIEVNPDIIDEVDSSTLYQIGQQHSYFDEQDFEQKNSTVDFAQAVSWYEKVAERGHRDAMFQLAMCRWYGDGSIISRDEAKKWFERAEKNAHGGAREPLASPQAILYNQKQ